MQVEGQGNSHHHVLFRGSLTQVANYCPPPEKKWDSAQQTQVIKLSKI